MSICESIWSNIGGKGKQGETRAKEEVSMERKAKSSLYLVIALVIQGVILAIGLRTLYPEVLRYGVVAVVALFDIAYYLEQSGYVLFFRYKAPYKLGVRKK